MKTSNKLLAAGTLILFITMIAFLMSMRGAMIKDDNTYLAGDGNIIEKTLGSFNGSSLNLRTHNYTIHPYSDQIIVKGDANILNMINVPLDSEEFDTRRLSSYRVESSTKKMRNRVLEPTQALEFTIGVKGLNKLFIKTDNGASVFSHDTLILEKLHLLIQSDRDSVNLAFTADKAELISQEANRSSVFRGEVGDLSVNLESGCKIKAEQLSAKDASVIIGYRAAAYLNVEESINGNALQYGKINNVGAADVSHIIDSK